MLNIRELVNRDLKIPNTIKNTATKVYVFKEVNAITESVIHNLLFRLENHEPNSVIYIEKGEDDEVTPQDERYSWYESVGETSKAFGIAAMYSGIFKTPIRVLSKLGNNTQRIPVTNNNTSVTIIGSTSESLSLASYEFSEEDYPTDIMLLQGTISDGVEYFGIEKSNPESFNVRSLCGKLPNISDNSEYLREAIRLESTLAQNIAVKMFNTINAYITEGMSLDYAYTETNVDTLENMVTEYFDKSTDILSDIDVQVPNPELRHRILNKLTELKDMYKENPDSVYADVSLGLLVSRIHQKMFDSSICSRNGFFNSTTQLLHSLDGCESPLDEYRMAVLVASEIAEYIITERVLNEANVRPSDIRAYKFAAFKLYNDLTTGYNL